MPRSCSRLHCTSPIRGQHPRRALARLPPMLHTPDETKTAQTRFLARLAGCHRRLQVGASLGLGFGQVQGFSGMLRVLQGTGAASGENRPNCRKARYQALFPDHTAAGRSLHGKEGSTFESVRGLENAPQSGAFCFRNTCTISSMQWVWSPLWSPQVQNARWKCPRSTHSPERLLDGAEPT
jgi:hypothetical protein